MKLLWRREKKKLSKMEFCVLCGRLTEYTADKPIDERYGYVSGCGQLCRDCYSKIKDEKWTENNL